MSIFNWDSIGDVSDRVPCDSVSVDQILVFSDDSRTVLITGGGDGKIRASRLFPNKVLGFIGTHNEGEDPIEFLALSLNKKFLGKSLFLSV